jgi:dolichol-phosphate mannosyltransferase
MRTVVVVPTYDEVDNVDRLLRAIREAVPDADVLIVDDNSPDGTADAAEAVGAELGRIDVLRRPGKDGLGNAYRAGFARAMDGGAEVLVTMDADLSHDPAVIPTLLAEIERGSDLAVGSRYVPGGETPNWPAHRQVLSRYGNLYTGWVLGLPVRDATSGFRAYRASTLQAMDVGATRASGYAFMTELAFRIKGLNGTISEVPIVFLDRERGTSKMSARIIVESMARVTWWGFRRRVKKPAVLRRVGVSSPARSVS